MRFKSFWFCTEKRKFEKRKKTNNTSNFSRQNFAIHSNRSLGRPQILNVGLIVVVRMPIVYVTMPIIYVTMFMLFLVGGFWTQILVSNELIIYRKSLVLYQNKIFGRVLHFWNSLIFVFRRRLTVFYRPNSKCKPFG